MDNSLDEKLSKFDEAIQHYETIAWQVTALFITATAVLIGAYEIPSFFIYFLGLTISISTILFNISFRRRQHFYICAKKEILRKMRKENKLEFCEKLELIINDCFDKGRFKQWTPYLGLLGLIIAYWFYRLFWWVESEYINLVSYELIPKIISFGCFLILSFLIILILNQMGNFNISKGIFCEAKERYS